MNETSVTAEIRQFIAEKIDAGVVVHVDWLTAEIISKKANITGADLPFYQVCAHTHVRGIVSKCIGRYSPKEKSPSDPQLTLPGFEYLQVAYTVTRNDDVVLVPIDMCGEAELLGRADDFDKQAGGMAAHALELRNYVRTRKKRASRSS